MTDDILSVDPDALKHAGVNLDTLSADVQRIRDELKYELTAYSGAGGSGDTFAKMWDENVIPGLTAAHDVLSGLADLIATNGKKVFGAGDIYGDGNSVAGDIAGGHGKKG